MPVFLPAALVVLAAGAAMAELGGAPQPAARPLANGSFTPLVHGRRIHYEVHGRGPALIALTNSWGLSLQALRVMYRPLEERLTLVYFDPRGMGGSGPAAADADRGMAAVREDFQALRRYLGLPKVNAIGWSNGAVNLLVLAAEHPDTLASAIFVHGVASSGPEDVQEIARTRPKFFAEYGAFMAEIGKPGLSTEQKDALQRKFWVEGYFPSLFADQASARPLVATVFKDAQLSWAHAVQTEKEMGGSFDVRARLASIPVRSLVLAGRHDLLAPERVKVIADGLKDARFLVFEKSGHFSPVEEPQAFRSAVFEFLGVARQQ